MNVLTITDQEVLQKRFKNILERQMSFTNSFAFSSRHALDLLRKGYHFQLFICIHPLDQDIQLLLNHLSNQMNQILILFCASDDEMEQLALNSPRSSLIGLVSHSKEDSIIISAIERLLHINHRKQFFEKDSISYCSLNLDLLSFVRELEYPLFVQLPSGNYHKIFNPKEPIDALSIKKLKEGKYQHFYIHQTDWPRVNLQIIDSTLHHHEKNHYDIDLNYQLLFTDLVYNTLVSLIKNQIINERILDLINICTDWLMKTSTSSPLELVLRNSTQIKHKRPIWIALTCLSIIPHIAFTKEEKFKSIFILASLLHDIDLLTKSDNNNDKEHILSVITLLDNFDNIPIELEKIIKQHHEEIDGSGFPEGLNYTLIHPFAQIFNLCQKFVDTILSIDDPEFDLHIIMDTFESLYKKSYYSMTVLTLKKVLGMVI